jgi:hypothetical protein
VTAKKFSGTIRAVTVYAGEAKFYRTHLRISWEFGSMLRKIKVLRPDAKMEDGRPLFLLEDAAIEKHKSRIRAYRQGLFAARKNIQEKVAA